VLDQAERKKNIQAELVTDLLEKGGVGAGSMGMEEQWLIDFKKSQKLRPLTLNIDRVHCTPQSTSMCVSQFVENSGGKEGVVELEAVYGCIGCSGKGQCHFLGSGEVVFPAARACVILSPNGQEQRIFTGHSQEVTCLIVHPSGRLIASASRLRGSVIFFI
jgi:WD40 repeat protein